MVPLPAVGLGQVPGRVRANLFQAQRDGEAMSKQPAERSESQASGGHDIAERDPLDGEGGGEGIELTMGEPNSFEPEEDPGASGDTETD